MPAQNFSCTSLNKTLSAATVKEISRVGQARPRPPRSSRHSLYFGSISGLCSNRWSGFWRPPASATVRRWTSRPSWPSWSWRPRTTPAPSSTSRTSITRSANRTERTPTTDDQNKKLAWKYSFSFNKIWKCDLGFVFFFSAMSSVPVFLYFSIYSKYVILANHHYFCS